MNETPVFLFTGFLESGKTRYIQEILEDKRFNAGERTLLIVCEEGVEEYDEGKFAGKAVFIQTVEDPSEINLQNFIKWFKASRAERVIIEYNGMWMLDDLYNAFPDGWAVYQEYMFAEARTFVSYNANMRQLVYDKLKSCELVVFNRYDNAIEKMDLHKIVRGVNRRCGIVYEFNDGNIVQDDIEDPLPFDINAPVITIADEDYAVWYRDLLDEPKKYENKVVSFKGRCMNRPNLPKETFVAGRHVMACCAQDIQYAGLVCQYAGASTIPDDSWRQITARVNFRFSRLYGKRGPVLTITETPANAVQPEDPVAVFY